MICCTSSPATPGRFFLLALLVWTDFVLLVARPSTGELCGVRVSRPYVGIAGHLAGEDLIPALLQRDLCRPLPGSTEASGERLIGAFPGTR